MKKLFFLLLPAAVLVLAGCGSQQPNANTIGGVLDLSKSAQEIQKDSASQSAVTSEDNVDNIYKFYNLNNQVKDEAAAKDAISQGLADGKNQTELNKTLARDKDFGSAYLLGYTFGCKATGKAETDCQNEMGQKLSEIMVEDLQNQIPGATQQ
ncbi:MAG: hypothetical protein WC518_01985 [Patescibacteria group bacterium]